MYCSPYIREKCTSCLGIVVLEPKTYELKGQVICSPNIQYTLVKHVQVTSITTPTQKKNGRQILVCSKCDSPLGKCSPEGERCSLVRPGRGFPVNLFPMALCSTCLFHFPLCTPSM